MVKHSKSIRLDPYQNEILKVKTLESGMSEGEYIGFLIEKDNTGRYKKPSADDYSQLQEKRFIIKLSETHIALLEALLKEYGKKNINNQKRSKNLKEFCNKYGLELKVAQTDLEKLVKLKIMSHGSGDESDYVWTNEGVFVLPEYVFRTSVGCPIVSGDIASLMHKMFGDYWDSVRFIQDELKMTRKQAKEIFKMVLGEHVLFLTWLREHTFDMTGIAEPTDVIYYRKQMMSFLMSYCLNVRDPDFIEADDEFRKTCDDLVKRLSNYFKKQKLF